MTIKAVIFDMGGTLETFNHTRELRLKATPGLRQCLASAGIDLGLDDAQLLDLVSAGLRRYHDWRMRTLLELPPARFWREYILADYAGGDPAVDPAALETVAEDLTFYIETRFYQRAMRPEVPAVLQAIRGMGLKIGLISNVSSQGQVRYSLEQYGIAEYFDPIVLSSEYGRRKPDPAIFHYAARLINVPTSQCLYVGDRIARDILGARRAGYRLAVQIIHNYAHGEQDDGPAPDAVIHQMTELLDVIRTENETPAKAPAGQIQALLFDAGDILYYRPERGQKLKAFLESLSLTGCVGAITENHAAQKQELHRQAYTGRLTSDQLHEALLRLYGVTQPEQIARGLQVLEEEDNDVRFFEGVGQTLAALKQKGYLLGIITDTANPVSLKLRWFEQGGLGSVWDAIISSQEIGVRKPDPAIYQAALRQLGLSAGQAVFVGHKASELDGARAVGMKTVAFNCDRDAQADIYIHRFPSLLAIPFISESERS